jgi:hypothetical protein
MKEANLISYAVIIDKKGKLVTEQKIADISVIKNELNPITYSTLETIMRTAKSEFTKIHTTLEKELDFKVYKD